MKLTRNGHLQLSKHDLLPQAEEPTWNKQKSISVDLFKPDVQIAIFYARQIKASIRYASIHGMFKVVGGGLWGYPNNVVKTWEEVTKKKRKATKSLFHSSSSNRVGPSREVELRKAEEMPK